jgi:hypothetical protein
LYVLKPPEIERRRELAARLGITMNALGIRAFRIRDGLIGCVEAAASAGDRFSGGGGQ